MSHPIFSPKMKYVKATCGAAASNCGVIDEHLFGVFLLLLPLAVSICFFQDKLHEEEDHELEINLGCSSLSWADGDK
jgi:hypothetical protein